MKLSDLLHHKSVKKITYETVNLENFTKEAIAIKFGNKIYDIRDEINDIQNCRAVTYQDNDGLEILRHDLAHIMAQAIKEIYPNQKPLFAIGPVIENGFFYDFDMEHKISEEELEEIEEKMHEIIKRNLNIVKYEIQRDLALEFFETIGDKYKVEIISSIPGNEPITIYVAGDGEFLDLCRGPHALTTRFQTAFKLNKIAGAYWRGDSKNKMLQRIYGVAFATKEELKIYLTRMKEAELRDHRKLGRELGLFHLQEEAQGQVFWHPRGYTIYKIIEKYIRAKLDQNGYVEVKTPLLADRVLWEKSGHWEKFKENMFVVEQKEDETKQFAIKPMNCPLHVQIFKQNIYSYRDLPLRMAEFGCCHRHESSGALHGIMRVLSFTQDDAHIFCTNDQITEEVVAFCRLLKEVYADFGFKDVKVKLSDRPEKRAGSDETWNQSELALETAIKAAQLPYTINKGEGAFYGPKLEFVLEDAIGRDWQCGTIQVDFVLPERLDAHYIEKDGSQKRPVMLHRAIIGTFERFIGILIENYAGNFPFWLAPVQIIIINVTNAVDDYALEVFEKFKNEFRTEIDLNNEQLNYKLRKYSKLKVPVICIIGNEEKNEKMVAFRYFGGKDTVKFKLDGIVNNIKEKFNLS